MTSPEFRLGDLMPAASAPAGPAVDVEGTIWREVQMMQASGWTLYQRWPGGADFQSVSASSISLGVHIILAIFTVGLWFLVWIPMELFGSGGTHKWCRLTLDELGRAQYSEIGRPKRS